MRSVSCANAVTESTKVKRIEMITRVFMACGPPDPECRRHAVRRDESRMARAAHLHRARVYSRLPLPAFFARHPSADDARCRLADQTAIHRQRKFARRAHRRSTG